MYRKSSRGYTLIELVVVITIIAIIAGIGIPQYQRTVETARALDATTTIKLVASANKSYQLDHGVFTAGQLTDVCNAACCAGAPGCGAALNDPCNLVACGYVPKQSFSGSYWSFFAVAGTDGYNNCSPPYGTKEIACGHRKRCSVDIGDPHCIDESAWPYRCWVYSIDESNVLSSYPNPKSPPPMP